MQQAGIRTFTVRLGQRTVFWFCIWLLTVMYASAIAIGLSSPVTAPMLREVILE